MASYTAPGVYIQDMPSGTQSIEQMSSSVGVLIGVTKSGELNVAHKISSWTEFIEKYANGLDTPFMENSYLAYSVYGFFQNGGRELYIGSVKKNATKATGTMTTSKLKFTSSNEGAWGNQITIDVSKSADWTSTNLLYDVKVSLGTSDSTTIREVSVADVCKSILTDSKASMWLSEAEFTGAGDKALAVESVTLSGGSDGDALHDSDYVDALKMVDFLDDATLIGIPGQTSNVVNNALMAYCDNNGLFPIIDMPNGATVESTKTYRKSISAWTGALCYPWGKMHDPLTDSLKAVPTVGHVMGVYARVIENRGVFKAPAGTEAVVRGFVEMQTRLSQADLSTLNPVGVICIISQPNAGIVVWGARSLNSTDSTMRYVSDGLLNLNIKRSLYRGTQFAVFEPNDEFLWSRVDTTCAAFLDTLLHKGALKGEGRGSAYYVTVDHTNNTDATINLGQLNIEIGYAPVKPAEFVIIKLSHSIVSAE